MQSVAPFGFQGTERFRLVAKLGAGGMGVVYRAADAERNVDVALKTLSGLDAEGLFRLKNEFRALQDVQHRNLVSLGELIEERGQWFFTMELVDGCDFLEYVRGPDGTPPGLPPVSEQISSPGRALHQAVIDDFADEPTQWDINKPRYDYDKLVSALVQVAKGLNALHRVGKAHRDIKPSNVMVAHDDRVVILDFGLVTETVHGEKSSASVVGTVGYMAPEQAAGKPIGPEADWYSVGVMLYEALTGFLPFDGPPLQVLIDKQKLEPVRPVVHVSAVPKEIDELCMGLLRADPAQRMNGADILRVLDADPSTQLSIASAVASSKATNFVGREKELFKLRTAFIASRNGGAVTVVIRGEAGMGKTALVRQFTKGLRTDLKDVVVLAGRCFERESVPYKAFDGVVDSLSRYVVKLPPREVPAILPPMASLLPQVFPVLRRVPAIDRAPGALLPIVDPQELRNRVFLGLRQMFGLIAKKHPLVIAIDDVQWADLDSLGLLKDLMRPPDAPQIFLIVTMRTGSDSRSKIAEKLAETLDACGDVRAINLESLRADQALEMTRKLLGTAPPHDEGVVKEIANEAGGHPLFIHELVLYARAHGVTSKGKLDLENAIWSRILRLDPIARRILEAIAVAGAPISQDVAAQASQTEFADFARFVQSLRGSFLVRTTGLRRTDPIEPYHDRVRSAVVSHLEESALQGYHERLALALESVPDVDPETVAAHWHAAGSADRAASFATQAADRAIESLAFDRAVELLRTAIKLHPSTGADARAIRTRLADALANAGRGAEAAREYLGAAGLGETVLSTTGGTPRPALSAQDTETLDLVRKASEQLLLTGHVDQGFATLQTVLDPLGLSIPATPRRALLSLLWHRTRLFFRGLSFTQRTEKEIDRQELARVDACWTVAAGLSMVDHIRGADFQTRHLLLALRAGEPHRVARALAVEAAYASGEGRKGRARAEELVGLVTKLGETVDVSQARALAVGARGLAAYYGGEWRRGLGLLDEAGGLLRERYVGGTWEVVTAQAGALWCLFYLGELGELGRRIDSLRDQATARGDLYAATSLGTGLLNIAWLCRDEPDRARAESEEYMRRWSKREFHVQHYWDMLALAHADMYEGRGVEANSLVTERWPALKRSLLLRFEPVRVEALHLRARTSLAAAKTAGGARATALVRVAEADAAMLDKIPARWAGSFAQLARAGAAAVRGDTARAIAQLESAAAGFDANEMAMYAAAARRRLGVLRGGAEGEALVAAADRYATSQGIKYPSRIVAVLAPGFAD